MHTIQALTFGHRSLISEYLTHNPPQISEYTFTNLFIWQVSRPLYFIELENSLVFLVKAKGGDSKYIVFGPPVGPITLPDIFTAMAGYIVGAIRISKDATQPLSKKTFTVVEDRDNADYVYRVADLATLSGRRYSKKRNKVKQCLSTYSCEYEKITAANIAECASMQNSWCQLRNCGHTPGLCSENQAIDTLFTHYSDFMNLIGGAIRVDGKIAAFAIGEELNPRTAVWHFEKAMPSMHGLGQLITHWFAKYDLQKVDYVNREQDLGMPGLRQAKLSYYPHHMVDKYSIWLGEQSAVPEIEYNGICELHEEE